VSGHSRNAARFPMPLPEVAPDADLARGEANDVTRDESERVSEHDIANGGLTPRQERFCRAFVAGNNGAGAAREAGYGPAGARQQAHRLLRRADVRSRVRALRHDIAEDNCLDARVLMAKLENVYRRALEFHHFHAAARAVEIQGRLSGHLIDGRRAAAPEDAAGGPPAPRSGAVCGGRENVGR